MPRHYIRITKTTNSKLSSKTNVRPLRQANGSLTVDPQGIPKLLSDHFGLVFAVDDCLYALFFRHACMVLSLHQLHLYNQLSKFSAN